MPGDQYHEPFKNLDEKTKDITRAINSLVEELQAIDWYNQRADVVADNPELKAILEHNRNEEMEHATMLLEWIRRNMSEWDGPMKKYLFTKLPVTLIEEAEKENPGEESGASLNIGSMKGRGE